MEHPSALFEECNLQNSSVNLDNGHVSVLPFDKGRIAGPLVTYWFRWYDHSREWSDVSERW